MMKTTMQKRSIIAAVVSVSLTIWLFLALGKPSLDYARAYVGLGGEVLVDQDTIATSNPATTTSPPMDTLPSSTPLVDESHELEHVPDIDSDTTPTGKPEAVERLAIATFLSGTLNQDDDFSEDNYFIATRTLMWQLLHSPETKVRRNDTDIVAIVTPSVTQSRRKQLEEDGATVYPIDFVTAEWLQTMESEKRWADVLAKLRAWSMTQYSRILLLDGDIVLREPIDAVFDDPAAQIQHLRTSPPNATVPFPDAAPLPESYLMACLGETASKIHPYPPTWEDGLQGNHTFNAGFMMLAPSDRLFTHYLSIVDTAYSFDPRYPEQTLLNTVHSWWGRAPWTELDYKWSIVHVNDNDLDAGVVTMHQKWWWEPYSGSQRVRDLLRQARWQMQGWYDSAGERKSRAQ